MGLKKSLISFVDRATKATTTINYAHHEIHDGSHYYIKGYVELDTDADIDFCITTPDSTKWGHMLFSISGTSITTIEIYEGSTYSTAGSAVTAINNNRNSTNTSVMSIASERSITALGTKISASKFGTATNPGNPLAGGSAAREDEVILKQNTSYTFRIISGADGNTIDYRANWYEHTSKG